MSSSFHTFARTTLTIAVLAFGSLLLPAQAFAQSDDDADAGMQIERLQNQLRQLTGQNEELQYRNRQLEDQLRQLQTAAPAAGVRPNVAAAAVPAQPYPAQPYPAQQQQQPGYDPQIAAPAPILQEPVAPAPAAQGRRRNDAFDPNANPTAPGAPRALGGGQLPAPANAPVGGPLTLNNANPNGAPPQASGGLTTLPPSATPKDEFDLGIGYIQRRDYALAEETMRNFTKKYPSDPLAGDSQYWLGESLFQRQKYRDAAEAFLGVTSNYQASAKAPDALLRLGQSLAALKQTEAACASFGEVTRKYPRASQGVKQAVEREQKRVKC